MTLLVTAPALAVPPAALARVLITVDEALELAFPGCAVERQTVFLSAEQVAAARALAGVEIGSALVHPYTARCNGAAAGTAYFDTHRVRTLEATLMVAIDTRGQVRRVEVLAFREPPEYIPREIWWLQFVGRDLDDGLQLKRGIHGVTGATLTAHAATNAVRRILALHQVVQQANAPPGSTGSSP